MENDIEMIYAIAKKIDMPEPVQASICQAAALLPADASALIPSLSGPQWEKSRLKLKKSLAMTDRA